ncbi:MAG TPA: molybdenum cofactor biosynthesis protein [Corynebacterium casei]|uniref:MogA/MoaB family molybdenum cofactor biosynthesis protein n=1 Tax=Corynebacterium casei TaxID=160386 RepID=UPI000ED95B9E|nr:MogA/MoaB family molybdenum cofactor biosynthesis protein [Corynebacterium casei]HCJ67987.1 molybdenum cofactor biosynthesis protein [Corynebacterium casei]
MNSKNTSDKPRTSLVVVASTRAAAGEYEDRSGKIAVEFLRSQGLDTPDAVIVADANIQSAIDNVLNGPDAPDVLLTSGGTGITPDDRTVEAVESHIVKELPGIAVAFWNKGLETVPTAALSRCTAGITRQTFVMTLPGSPGGVKDGCAVLEGILGHIIDVMKGNNEH